MDHTVHTDHSDHRDHFDHEDHVDYIDHVYHFDYIDHVNIAHTNFLADIYHLAHHISHTEHVDHVELTSMSFLVSALQYSPVVHRTLTQLAQASHRVEHDYPAMPQPQYESEWESKNRIQLSGFGRHLAWPLGHLAGLLAWPKRLCVTAQNERCNR